MRRQLCSLLSLSVLLVSCEISQVRTTSSFQSNRKPAQDGSSALRPGFVALNKLDKAKKTVCAMTLNSDNEILTFQKYLSPKQFQFVELVTTEDHWLTKAVEAQVKCDVLVVSGHFGGTFFGENGRLELEELETSTCSPEGRGIFHEVKEVFLFGCNTLAGKIPDHRSPEEYIRVLIEDGFTAAQAQQVAAFRYSPLGNTFSDRMSRVFAGVPRIYGFTSVGPSGKNVQPMLERYLSGRGDYGTYLDKIDKNENKEFLQALRYTAVAQTTGAASAESKLIPRCVLADPQVGESAKLKLIDSLIMNPEKRLSHLGEVADYLLKVRRNGANRKLELELSRKWASAGLRQDMKKVLDQGIKSYPALRLEMTSIGAYFGWLTSSEVKAIAREVVGDFFKDGLTQEESDFLISIGEIAGRFVTYEMVKDHLRSPLVIDTLGGIKVRDPKIHWALVEVMKNDGDYFVREAAALALGYIAPQDPKIHWALVEVMNNDSVSFVRLNAAWALGYIAPQDPKIHWVLVEVMKNDGDSVVREAAAWALGYIVPQDPKIHWALVEVMKNDSEPDVRLKAAETLEGIKPQDPLIVIELQKWRDAQ